jgi:hypothetical protein
MRAMMGTVRDIICHREGVPVLPELKDPRQWILEDHLGAAVEAKVIRQRGAPLTACTRAGGSMSAEAEWNSGYNAASLRGRHF